MVDLFITLLMAHLLGDFVFQTDKINEMKQKLWGQLLHSFLIILITAVLIPTYQGLFLAWIMGSTHFIIDFIKIQIKRNDSLVLFIVDQLFHLFVIIFLVFTLGMRFELFWFYQSRTGMLTLQLMVIGLILNTGVSNWIIVKFFQGHYPIEFLGQGLENAGKYIGYLERIIIMIMVLTANITGIGFLVTAKSILRIGRLTDNEHKREAEYIILGTFLSIVLALAWSYSIKCLLKLI